MASQTAQRIRYAAHGLVSAWAEHDQRSAEVLAQTSRDADRMARLLGPVRHGGAALAQQVTDVMAAGTQQASRELARAGEAFGTETRAMLALLTGDPSLATASVSLPPPGSGVAAIVASFPTRASRRFVGHVLSDQPDSWAVPTQRAALADVTDPVASTAHLEATAMQFDTSLRDAIKRMFGHPKSHAIQVHGPDVTDEALQARVSWRKDPAGRTDPYNLWQLNADDSVMTEHRVGATTGRFDTIDALVKPLKTIIDHNGGTLAGLDAYLSAENPSRVGLFVPAELAGLQPGETTGFRGSGARNSDMAEHWVLGREYAMDTGAAPMPIVATDQIADGSDPGAAIIFRKIGQDWIVVTCYPLAEPLKSLTRFGRPTS